MLTTLAALAALLAVPSLAQADHGPPAGGPELERYLQIAQAHWGVPAPTCASADGQALGVHAVLYDDPDRGVSARAEHPGCRIWLDTDFWPRPLDEIDCTIVVHEWGHLLGHGHSADQGSLMYEQPTQGAPGCALLRAGRATQARESPPRNARPRARRSPHLKHASGVKTRRAGARGGQAHRKAARRAKRRCARRLRRAHGTRRAIARKRARCVRRAIRRR